MTESELISPINEINNNTFSILPFKTDNININQLQNFINKKQNIKNSIINMEKSYKSFDETKNQLLESKLKINKNNNEIYNYYTHNNKLIARSIVDGRISELMLKEIEQLKKETEDMSGEIKKLNEETKLNNKLTKEEFKNNQKAKEECFKVSNDINNLIELKKSMINILLNYQTENKKLKLQLMEKNEKCKHSCNVINNLISKYKLDQ